MIQRGFYVSAAEQDVMAQIQINGFAASAVASYQQENVLYGWLSLELGPLKLFCGVRS
jgi:hypothetical protein